MKKTKAEKKPVRVHRIGRKLAAHRELKKSKTDAWGAKPFRRKQSSGKRHAMIAYDLETTLIKPDETPRALYITAYCDTWNCSARIQSDEHLGELLAARFLIPEFNRARFVAWNGNNFDVYLIARALLLLPGFVLRPYLTRSKGLRGIKVIKSERWRNPKGRDVVLSWEFLDGISMTGSIGVSLRKFLEQFAPNYGKLAGPDFDHGEQFDPSSRSHVAYAERDSEGLWHAMKEVEKIVVDNFDLGLQPTIGNLGIKIFQANMPQGVTVWKPAYAALAAIRNQVMRGGYCYRARRHDGALWKYDLNQAYAAAMRDARLPCGRMYWNPPADGTSAALKGATRAALNKYAKVFIVRVIGKHPKNRVPFYCRDMQGASIFAEKEIPETWLTSIEYEQLKSEGAKLKVLESYFWDEHFSMTDFVNRLEKIRMEAQGGPAGPKGQVIKYIGNNAYGKTVERLDGIELLMAFECPEGYAHYQSENDQLQCVWYRFAEPVLREYHQPQLGAFITAQVRMQLRRAILPAVSAWVYADTDCVGFDRPVHHLPIDPKRYGLWKLEEAGTEFYVIEKKVYAKKDGTSTHAKGMNVSRLSMAEMKAWYEGHPPEQKQVQRNNFVSFVTGNAMFKERVKVGQRV